MSSRKKQTVNLPKGEKPMKPPKRVEVKRQSFAGLATASASWDPNLAAARTDAANVVAARKLARRAEIAAHLARSTWRDDHLADAVAARKTARITARKTARYAQQEAARKADRDAARKADGIHMADDWELDNDLAAAAPLIDQNSAHGSRLETARAADLGVDLEVATPFILQISAPGSVAIDIRDDSAADREAEEPDQNSAPSSLAIVMPPTMYPERIFNENVSRRNKELSFLIINFLIEIFSAFFDQISSKHKPIYALVVMLISFIATLLSIVELAYKARTKRVVWRWEGCLPWFYHPHPRNERFGTFPEIFGLVCAILQSIVSAIIYGLYLHNSDYPIKISFWPIIFSFGLFCSKLMENQDQNDIPSAMSRPEESQAEEPLLPA